MRIDLQRSGPALLLLQRQQYRLPLKFLLAPIDMQLNCLEQIGSILAHGSIYSMLSLQLLWSHRLKGCDASQGYKSIPRTGPQCHRQFVKLVYSLLLEHRELIPSLTMLGPNVDKATFSCSVYMLPQLSVYSTSSRLITNHTRKVTCRDHYKYPSSFTLIDHNGCSNNMKLILLGLRNSVHEL